ncbi:hypothetical protein [Marinomonas alcarazii]|uniref:hypothetical protein n=1 Tax=Marinomonas alcarazii TaxID=491949 RepID=UPI001C648352|nr:hypothetical protein [Marinomonas alcarazii]
MSNFYNAFRSTIWLDAVPHYYRRYAGCGKLAKIIAPIAQVGFMETLGFYPG